MHFPTGPAIVGLEPRVLPVSVELVIEQAGPVLVFTVTAPLNRFGPAIYTVHARRPDGSYHHPSKMLLGGMFGFGLMAGGTSSIHVPTADAWVGTVLELELLHDTIPHPVEWARLTDQDILDALMCPDEQLRQEAFLALAERNAGTG
jgi:hypothetical protein